jgi:hypothetical protein
VGVFVTVLRPFGGPSCELPLRCVRVPNLGEAVLNSLPPSQNFLCFGHPYDRLTLLSLWKPQVFSPPHLCRWLFGFCWLGAALGDLPRFWAPLWQTRFAFPLETPSFLPTAPLSLALLVLLVGCSSCRLTSVLGAPLADSPCVPSGNPKFSPHSTSIAGSFSFVGWALLLVTHLGFGCPSG